MKKNKNHSKRKTHRKKNTKRKTHRKKNIKRRKSLRRKSLRRKSLRRKSLRRKKRKGGSGVFDTSVNTSGNTSVNKDSETDIKTNHKVLVDSSDTEVQLPSFKLLGYKLTVEETRKGFSKNMKIYEVDEIDMDLNPNFKVKASLRKWDDDKEIPRMLSITLTKRAGNIQWPSGDKSATIKMENPQIKKFKMSGETDKESVYQIFSLNEPGQPDYILVKDFDKYDSQGETYVTIPDDENIVDFLSDEISGE